MQSVSLFVTRPALAALLGFIVQGSFGAAFVLWPLVFIGYLQMIEECAQTFRRDFF